jgi:hypothetical protein
MEAYMYRCHPVTALAAKILREGTIGEVRMMKAGFSYAMPTDCGNIRFNNAFGGGAIMDVGGYTLSMLRLLAGAALGRSVSAEPLDLQAVASIGAKSRVDEWAAASVRFEGGILGQLTTGCAIDTENIVTVWGTKGSLTLTNPWFPGRQGDGLIQLAVKGKNPKTIKSASKVPLYALEADTVARALPGREAPYPCMTWAESLAQIRAVDLWREKVGLVFDAEKPISLKSPIAAESSPSVHGRNTSCAMDSSPDRRKKSPVSSSAPCSTSCPIRRTPTPCSIITSPPEATPSTRPMFTAPRNLSGTGSPPARCATAFSLSAKGRPST